MSPARTPEEILAELGSELDRAYRTRSPALARRASRTVAALALVAVLGASTAAATKSLFSASPPLPRLAPAAVDLASGAGWRLSLTHCSGTPGSVSLLLATRDGGAGSPCGPLVQPPTAYYGPRQVMAFGVLPPRAVRVELTVGLSVVRARAIDADGLALGAAGLPAGERVYSVAVPRAPLKALAAFDDRGRLVLACQPRRCIQP